jgi:hypothetical protein
MAERQILFDTVSVGWPDERCFPQRPSAFGTLALQQMATARATAEDFTRTGDLEPLGHGLSSLNTFGTSHTVTLSLKSA